MENLLVCKNLTKRYVTGVTALDKINLSTEAHGIFALIGRNGAGKTTLIRILSTELLPTSGTATINGIDIVKEAETLREQIAILPQESRAIQWLTPRQTIFSYLLYRGLGVKEASARVSGALENLGIKKYENSVNRFLSGGLKRKVLMATILSSRAKILFVDEPTTGLDPLSRAELWNTLKKLKKDHFIFLTTHYLEEAEKLADLIGIIDNGKLLRIGTLDELRKSMKYQYSIRVLQEGVAIKPRSGEVITGLDGSSQILTTEQEADTITKRLIARRIKFAVNPVSLEDIFYYYVKKPIEESSEEESSEWG